MLLYDDYLGVFFFGSVMEIGDGNEMDLGR